jgi:hypothetical protein
MTNRRDFTRRLFVWLEQVKVDRELSPVAFKVAFEIGQHFNARRGGAAWPSSLTIARKIGVDEATVIRTVRRLRERGHLIVDPGRPGRGYSNRYRMARKPAAAQVSEVSRKPAPVSVKPAPVQENYLEPSMGDASASPHKERESGSRSLTTIPPVAGAPYGAATEGFADLWSLWSSARLYNTDAHRTEAWRVYVIVGVDEDTRREIKARAVQYLASKADDRRHIHQLANWLSNDNWKKPPPPRRQRKGGKAPLAEMMLAKARS